MESDIVATDNRFAKLLLSDAEPQASNPITIRHQPTKPTLDTLPAEVLDSILDNLLRISEEHCHVKFLGDIDSPERRVKDGNAIDIDILRVNKALCQAARTFLYSQNRFVILDYCQVSPAIPHFAAVRFVTDKHLKEFERHIVHLHWDFSPKYIKHATEFQGRCLLLASEIEAVALYAQTHNFSDFRSLIYMSSGDDGALEPTLPEYTGLDTRFSVTLRKTDFSRQDLTESEISTEQEVLLSSMSLLCGHRVELELHGVLDQGLRDAFLAQRNKRIAFQDAIPWDAVNNLHLLEHRLASLLLGNNLGQSKISLLAALEGYLGLCAWATNKLLPKRDGLNPIHASFRDAQIGTPVTESWQYGLVMIVFDVFITMVSIAVRSDVPASLLSDTRREFLHLFDRLPGPLLQSSPSELKAKLTHVLAVVAFADRLPVNSVRWLNMGLRLCPNDEFLKADLAVYDSTSSRDLHASSSRQSRGLLMSQMQTHFVPAHYIAGLYPISTYRHGVSDGPTHVTRWSRNRSKSYIERPMKAWKRGEWPDSSISLDAVERSSKLAGELVDRGTEEIGLYPD